MSDTKSDPKIENQPENIPANPGRKKKLSKGQKKRLMQKRRFKRERIEETALIGIHTKTGLPGEKSTVEETVKDRIKNSHKAAFEQILGDDLKGQKQYNPKFWSSRVPRAKREEWLIN